MHICTAQRAHLGHRAGDTVVHSTRQHAQHAQHAHHGCPLRGAAQLAHHPPCAYAASDQVFGASHPLQRTTSCCVPSWMSWQSGTPTSSELIHGWHRGPRLVRMHGCACAMRRCPLNRLLPPLRHSLRHLPVCLVLSVATCPCRRSVHSMLNRRWLLTLCCSAPPPCRSVYYVLNNPPRGWQGGKGFVTADMIKCGGVGLYWCCVKALMCRSESRSSSDGALVWRHVLLAMRLHCGGTFSSQRSGTAGLLHTSCLPAPHPTPPHPIPSQLTHPPQEAPALPRHRCAHPALRPRPHEQGGRVLWGVGGFQGVLWGLVGAGAG